jgi:hypothetical protein
MANYQDFGLQKENLYEVIATTYSYIEESKEIRPHASCMGIRLLEEGQIQISPFYSTTTYKNLKNHSIITINFVDDVYLYALAALKEHKSPIGLTNFPSKYYSFKYLESFAMDVPFITKAWGIFVGKVSKEFQKTKKDDLGEVMIPVFKLDIIFSERFRESNKLINRAENLALETIILATRLKIAKQNKNKTQFMKINNKIGEHVKSIERFGKNKNALKVIDLINNYVSKLID